MSFLSGKVDVNGTFPSFGGAFLVLLRGGTLSTGEVNVINLNKTRNGTRFEFWLVKTSLEWLAVCLVSTVFCGLSKGEFIFFVCYDLCITGENLVGDEQICAAGIELIFLSLQCTKTKDWTNLYCLAVLLFANKGEAWWNRIWRYLWFSTKCCWLIIPDLF